MKAGWKTSEFWFVIIFAVLQMVAVGLGFITDPTISVIATGILGAVYAVARTLAKVLGYEDVPDIDIPAPKKSES